MNSLASLDTLSALRNGDTLTADADLNLRLSGKAPVAFDLQWLRSLAGFLLGSTGIRIESEAAAAVSVALSSHCLATVRRQDRAAEPWLRLTLEKNRDLSLDPNLTVQAALPVPGPLDPLRLALTGSHPRQILRSVLKSLGSAAFSLFIQKSGIRSRHIAELAALWPSLSAAAEPILWSAAQDPDRVSAIRDFTRWLAEESPSASAVHEKLLLPSDGPASITSTLIQWLEALTGQPVSALLSPSALRYATIAARACLPLLQLPELPSLLGQILHTPPAFPPKDSPAAAGLARRLYLSAGPALAQTLSADLSLRLSAQSTHTLLLDASFRMDPPGLELYRHALDGNLTPLLAASSPSFELHSALFTHSLLRRRTLEIHLPFGFSTTRDKELASLAQTEIVPGGNGRLNVVKAAARSTASRKSSLFAARGEQHSRMIIAASVSAADREPLNDNFSLSFSDVRDIIPGRNYQGYLQVLAAYGIHNVTLPPCPARATLTITLPGSAVKAWSSLPLGRSEALRPLLCRASLALQSTLRRWIPELYLANPARYATPAVIFPLLAYQFSQPYARVGRGHFSYDAMNPEHLRTALNSAAPRLKAPLTRIQSLLAASGQRALAAHYDPSRLPEILPSILLQKRHFAALLSADSFFIEQVLSLARYSRDLSTTAAKNPKRAARDLQTFTRDFVQVFHRRLARLYGGQDFIALGSLLLIEATAALSGRRDALHASFTLEPIEPGPGA
jgi:hypothetical protein